MGQSALFLAVTASVGAAAAMGTWGGLWIANRIASALVDVRRDV
ncbi:hypothetical protein LMG23992_04873 [Cupriavidus laharis]|uniref:Uncharacterized protein n=1 Tax=Cupriavidus laharis TaxID=151654 RepID=A0ABM8XRN5_9BURK|nr:hypothetical protein LMG23992_04873 [Cupriavidus laharis]